MEAELAGLAVEDVALRAQAPTATAMIRRAVIGHGLRQEGM